MKLTDAAAKAAKLNPGVAEKKFTDGHGLFLLVRANGSRSWRFKYHLGARERTMVLGPYPALSLKQARVLHTEARVMVARGIDPMVTRDASIQALEQAKAAEAVALKLAKQDSVKAVALEWFDNQVRVGRFKAKTITQTNWLFNNYLFPKFGDRPIRSIKGAEVLEWLKSIEREGKLEVVIRLRQRMGNIFNLAELGERLDKNPMNLLRGQLATSKKKRKHHAGLTDPRQVGQLLLDLDQYEGAFATRMALRLAPHFFMRPGEVRFAKWEQFDLAAQLWRVPGQLMKMDEAHLVPLSRQALAMLEELARVTSGAHYMFSTLHSALRPLSENTLNQALRRLGYDKTQMTSHGFRTTASTLLNELGYNADHIEMQLAHKPGDETRSSYNQAKWLEARREMMQHWSDYLDTLREQARQARAAQIALASGAAA